MGESITIRDIAKDAGVSVSTVSRVMNDTAMVSDDLRERVMTSVRRLHYRPNAAARSLITKRSNIIAVVEADMMNPVTTMILKEIDEYCTHRNKIMMTCDYGYSNDKAISLLNNLLERNVDGVVFMGVVLEERILQKLEEFPCPVVLAQQGEEGERQRFTTVTDDSYHAEKDVTNFLIRENHRRIAFIGGDANDYTNERLRLKGFLDAMEENGLDIPTTYIAQTEFSLEGGKTGMRQIYENNLILPTAVVAGSDVIAAGAIRYLKEMGMRVPEDVSVFGFDDSVDDLFEIPLSTVRSYDRGKIICEQLFAEGEDADKKKEWIYYPYRVLRRSSTRRAAEKV
ncbi:MAG: LacI family DNA-binding transcriptional regulator [Eubacteriales bacterium]|nr:LacI family DNA-binding transcriptional regulator [Eubacteriales bacterium]